MDTWPIEEPELCGALKPDARPELAENCGAGRTAANPFLATSWFTWLRLLTEPRGIPMPADPALTTTRDGAKGDAGPPLPTNTVFTVPEVGATSGWTWTNVVGV